MKLSTKTILIIGFVQCVILTLVLILFLRWEERLGVKEPVSGATETDAPSIQRPPEASPLPLAPDSRMPEKQPRSYPDNIEPL
jgi:hypothetical protein